MNKREIKFRYTFKRISDGKIWQEIVPIECLEGNGDVPFVLKYKDGMTMSLPEWELIARDLFTGLKDKQGKDIYEGGEITFRKPYRTTQTHYGDNIPNGEYTEPMEPGIKIHSGIIVFQDCCFKFKDYDTDELTPLEWIDIQWDLETIKEAISWTRQDGEWFD